MSSTITAAAAAVGLLVGTALPCPPAARWAVGAAGRVLGRLAPFRAGDAFEDGDDRSARMERLREAVQRHAANPADTERLLLATAALGSRRRATNPLQDKP